MHSAVKVFENSITDARGLSGLHAFLSENVKAPISFDDLLRFQIVYTVSAFDKLMHDLIRIGMLEAYLGKRPITARFHSETITIKFHSSLVGATTPPKEVLFEQEIARKLSYLSFQDPDKIGEGLSLIWDEKHKWTKIANAMGHDPDAVRTKLKLIVSRRNAIVHESDMQPITNVKTSISEAETADITGFVELVGKTIGNLVK
ncbi:HEPN domain-containing protein [Methylocystis sp. ATCC 49242]|uniref:HEPN domain-containing protein n=1 Tax=Methylocystis sp. ATCC 49242 TaxID=622637 RepID=UPI0001F87E56|nr:HEPN domain-containing protein [Methylocystis sp. ATCC 49242]